MDTAPQTSPSLAALESAMSAALAASASAADPGGDRAGDSSGGRADDATRLLQALRAALPGQRIRAVDALDVRDEKPVLQRGHCALYGLVGDGHCWQLTADAAAARAWLLAVGVTPATPATSA